MKNFKITSNCSVQENEMYSFVYDAEADFEQIVLSVRWAEKQVRIRVVSLGDAIEVEAWNNRKMVSVIKIANDHLAHNAVNNIITLAFA